MCGVCLLLQECRLPASLASVVTTILTLAWLTWPIWLSPALVSHERALGWLCWLHPVLAMNSIVRHLGLWGSPMGGSDLAYRFLTNLNQDVAYPKTRSIWPCVSLHLLIGMPLLGVGMLLGRLKAYRTSPVSAGV